MVDGRSDLGIVVEVTGARRLAGETRPSIRSPGVAGHRVMDGIDQSSGPYEADTEEMNDEE